MSEQRWQPAADLETLKARSRLMSVLRAFFDARDYLEVDSAILNRSGTVDPNIDSVPAGSDYWLHTSPEFGMKRLLAAGSGPIYQICKVFRAGEQGRLHNPEFTMLEWYRPGYDHHALMSEMDVLMQQLNLLDQDQTCERLTYADAFERYLGVNPHQADMATLANLAADNDIRLHSELEKTDAWLDLLMGEVVGPKLGQEKPCFIYDYPASQAALAKVREGHPPVAERFELYWRGVELANGFHELTDAAEQRSRFERESQSRKALNRPTPEIDEALLQALESGLPDCAGVALGVDRLLMLMLGKSSVAEVISFPDDRV